MVVAFYFRLHLAYFPRPVVAIFARPEQCGLPKIFENGRKKSSKPFQDLLLIYRCDGRRY